MATAPDTYIKQFFTVVITVSGRLEAVPLGRVLTKHRLLKIFIYPIKPATETGVKYRVTASHFRPLYGARLCRCRNLLLKNSDPDKPGAAFSKSF
jgi:hypothetical protein